MQILGSKEGMNKEAKELPSIELSLKYMAWDVKKLGEAVVDLNNNFKLFMGMSRTKQNQNVSGMDENPF